MAHVATRGHNQAPTRALAEVLLEERRLGGWLKVAAVDPLTGEEAIAVGPADSPAAVRQAAIGKLRRRIAGR